MRLHYLHLLFQNINKATQSSVGWEVLVGTAAIDVSCIEEGITRKVGRNTPLSLLSSPLQSSKRSLVNKLPQSLPF